jgi:hypothetical protein
MAKPAKITLAEAQAQGATELLFYCTNTAAACWRSGGMPLAAAIARWGEARRLDQIPARCTGCDSREFVDVRALQPRPQASGRLDALVRKAWRN